MATVLDALMNNSKTSPRYEKPKDRLVAAAARYVELIGGQPIAAYDNVVAYKLNDELRFAVVSKEDYSSHTVTRDEVRHEFEQALIKYANDLEGNIPEGKIFFDIIQFHILSEDRAILRMDREA